MALKRGSKRLFDWLRQQPAGKVVTRQEIMSIAEWSPVSLKTYITKNKVAPFLQPIAGDRLKVLLDGDEIDEQFFDETFTQKAPRPITLGAGDVLGGEHDSYKLAEPLGNGAVGHVWAANAQSKNRSIAAKVMLPRQDLLQTSKLPNVRERFRREAKNGQSLRHPNVVRYLDAGQLQNNPFLIMELADGSVADELKRSGAFAEEEAARIVLACIAGLRFLHEKKCVHRDVKPANILRFRQAFKLGDLGIVRWSDFDPAFTKGGTITRDSVQLGSFYYSAPEQQGSPHNVDGACDVYALGVTWIEMLTGAVPAPHAVGAGAYELPSLSAPIAELVGRMCSYVPTTRPTLGEAETTLRNAYGGDLSAQDTK